MATKLKNTKGIRSLFKDKKRRKAVACLVALFFAGHWLYISYWSIHWQARNQQENFHETEAFTELITNVSQGLYFDLLMQTQEEALNDLVQINQLLSEETFENLFERSFSEVSTRELEAFTREFASKELENALESFRSQRLSFPNLQFAAMHTESEAVVSSGNDLLIQAVKQQENPEEIGWNFNYFLLITFDARGQMRVLHANSWGGMSQQRISESLQRSELPELDARYLSWNPIRNTTFVFALDEDFVHHDGMSHFQQIQYNRAFVWAFAEFAIHVLGFVTVAALLIPVKWGEPYELVQKALSRPLEHVILAISLALVTLFGVMPTLARWSLSRPRWWFGPISSHVVMWVVHVGLLMSIFAVVSLTIHYLKKRQFYLSHEFKERRTVKVALVQAVAISIMCLFGPWGIGLAVVYGCLTALWVRKQPTPVAGPTETEMFQQVLATLKPEVEASVFTQVSEALGIAEEVELPFVDVSLVLEDLLARTPMGDLTLRPQLLHEEVLVQVNEKKLRQTFEKVLDYVVQTAQSGTRMYVDVVDSDESIAVMLRSMSALEVTEAEVQADLVVSAGYLTVHVDGDLIKLILTFNK